MGKDIPVTLSLASSFPLTTNDIVISNMCLKRYNLHVWTQTMHHNCILTMLYLYFDIIIVLDKNIKLSKEVVGSRERAPVN